MTVAAIAIMTLLAIMAFIVMGVFATQLAGWYNRQADMYARWAGIRKWMRASSWRQMSRAIICQMVAYGLIAAWIGSVVGWTLWVVSAG